MKCWNCGVDLQKLGMQVIVFGEPDDSGCDHDWTIGEDDRFPDLTYYQELVAEFGKPVKHESV